jgi:hypothetical protein
VRPGLRRAGPEHHNDARLAPASPARTCHPIGADYAAGCHVGDLADFDHYLDVNDISHDRAGEAFADYLTLQYGWSGQVQRVDLHIAE